MATPILSDLWGIPNLILPYISHCSENLVDLDEVFKFMKLNHQGFDRREAPRRNQIRIEIEKFHKGIVEKDDKKYMTVGAFLRYCFIHSDDFSVCQTIVDGTVRQLSNRTHQSRAPEGKQDEEEKTVFQLYQEVSKSEEITTVGAINITSIELQDSELPYIHAAYRNAFTKEEWLKVHVFEFQFSNFEKERHKSDESCGNVPSIFLRKWSLWNATKASMDLGMKVRQMNHFVCGYQRRRMSTAESIEDVSFTISGIQHLPTIIEDVVREVVTLNKFKVSGNIITVNCSENCNHTEGVHVFLESDETSTSMSSREFVDVSLIIRASLKDHVFVQDIVNMDYDSLKKIFKNNEQDRFSLLDNLLLKRLGKHVLYIDINTEDNDIPEDADETTLCSICYEKQEEWIKYPLSVSTYDYLQEWMIFVPLPVRMFLQQSFLNVKSLKQSGDVYELLQDKVARLTALYDVGLNTLNKNYFGLSQEMNTAELIVNYHSATSVFSITQASGITMSLRSAEKKLKRMANPERCYFRTYLKAYPLEYTLTHDLVPKTHHVRLRDCHIILLVDNLVRVQKARDPDQGSKKSSQLCTLPITVKGLPRNSNITKNWHTEECDGSFSCSCKTDQEVSKADLDKILLENSEEEENSLCQFKQDAVWGLKNLCDHQEVKNMLLNAAVKYTPLNSCDNTDDLSVSLKNMSLQEVDEENQEDIEALQRSITNMSFQDSPTKYGTSKDSPSVNHNYQSSSRIVTSGMNGNEPQQSNLIESICTVVNHTRAAFQSTHPGTIVTDVKQTEDTSKITNQSSKDSTVIQQEDQSTFSTRLEHHETSQRERSQNTELSSRNSTSSFSKFQVPPLLCRHPPPAEGRDDDIRKLREILDDVLTKSGHYIQTDNSRDKVLLAPDHKIANNVFKLMKEPKYKHLLPEFPVLHLVKSKINNLVSAYKPMGFVQMVKYMKDDENETDWSKVVTLSEIEGAARTIRRLAIALHLAIFCTFLESLQSIEADNLLIDMEALPLFEVESRWNSVYEKFIETASKTNATFCLHVELMNHCDEVVGIQLAERIGGATGYNLLRALVKASLPFSFLNGASSYAAFCVQLLFEHSKSGFFYQRLKETLFTTPHKNYEANFGLDAQREMDHRDVIKGFRSSSSLESILPRMAVIDDLQMIQDARHVRKAKHESRPSGNTTILFGKEINDKDIKFVCRCAQMILRCGALNTTPEEIPRNSYNRKSPPLTQCMLDRETTKIGKFLIYKFICKIGLAGASEADCPSVDNVIGPKELVKKVKAGKSTTVQRARCKPDVPKSQKEMVEEKRQKEIKKLNKLAKHTTSTMNTCQAIVNPDCSKTETPKSKGIRDAIGLALLYKEDSMNPVPKETISNARKRRTVKLEEDGLIYLQADEVPPDVQTSIKVIIIEFAGIKFKSFAKTGQEFIDIVQNNLLQPLLKEYKKTDHIIICEEKYSFTPDVFKALTREKRQKEDQYDVFHLKSKEEMLSLSAFSKGALTKTAEGKKLISSFLAAHVQDMKFNKNLTLDIDSEYLLKEDNTGQYAVPIRAIFEENGTKVTTSALEDVKQSKGEAEMSQVDWLPYIVPDLDEGENVLSYVTSGDIDSLPIHILATSMYWPRLPNRKFKNNIYLLLKKPQSEIKPDLLCVTKIIEKLEEDNPNEDIGIITSLSLCLGGNDFLPKFFNISHMQWVSTIFSERRFLDGLFKITRDQNSLKILSIHLNVDIYLDVLRKLYCPKGLDYTKLSFEDIRQITIKLPGKPIKPNPQQWLPPRSALKKICCLIQSHIQYMLTVCKPQSGLPNFLNNGGLCQTGDGEIAYDFGDEIRYNDERELIIIDETLLQDKIDKARPSRAKAKKRDLSVTPKKETSRAKRALYTSTPRKMEAVAQSDLGNDGSDDDEFNMVENLEDPDNLAMEELEEIDSLDDDEDDGDNNNEDEEGKDRE